MSPLMPAANRSIEISSPRLHYGRAAYYRSTIIPLPCHRVIWEPPIYQCAWFCWPGRRIAAIRQGMYQYGLWGCQGGDMGMSLYIKTKRGKWNLMWDNKKIRLMYFWYTFSRFTLKNNLFAKWFAGCGATPKQHNNANKSFNSKMFSVFNFPFATSEVCAKTEYKRNWVYLLFRKYH